MELSQIENKEEDQFEDKQTPLEVDTLTDREPMPIIKAESENRKVCNNARLI